MIELDGTRFYSMADITNAPGVTPDDAVNELEHCSVFRFQGVALFEGKAAGTDGFFTPNDYPGWPKLVITEGLSVRPPQTEPITSLEDEQDEPFFLGLADYDLYPSLSMHPYVANFGGRIIRGGSDSGAELQTMQPREKQGIEVRSLYFPASDAVFDFAARFLVTLPEQDQRYVMPKRGQKKAAVPAAIQADKDTSKFDPRERKTLLKIIRVLAEHANLDLGQPFAAAAVVARYASTHKVPLPTKLDTIARHLEAAAKIEKTL